MFFVALNIFLIHLVTSADIDDQVSKVDPSMFDDQQMCEILVSGFENQNDFKDKDEAQKYAKKQKKTCSRGAGFFMFSFLYLESVTDTHIPGSS